MGSELSWLEKDFKLVFFFLPKIITGVVVVVVCEFVSLQFLFVEVVELGFLTFPLE